MDETICRWLVVKAKGGDMIVQSICVDWAEGKHIGLDSFTIARGKPQPGLN